MRKTPNTKKIGIFTLVGLILFFAIIVTALGGKIFSQDDDKVVFFFDESIKGLSIGSPVVFQGVLVGKVVSINLDISKKTENFTIPVIAEMTNFYNHKEFKGESKYLILKHFIDKGMRARLTSQNILTGQLMIDLDFLPNTPMVFKNEKTKYKYLEIPTVLSEFSKIRKDINDIPVNEIMRELDTLLDTLNDNAPVIMAQLVQFLNALNNPEAASGLGGGVASSLNNAMLSIAKAAKSINNFADYLDRNPQALLIGKGNY